MKIKISAASVISYKGIKLSEIEGLTQEAIEFLEGTNDDQSFITDYLVNSDSSYEKIWTNDLENFLEDSNDEIEEKLKAELTKLIKSLSYAEIDYILNNQ